MLLNYSFFNEIPGGAWDGELESNTLLFELERNWRGLLIEPNKQNFVHLVQKHRNTLMLETCLSMKNKYELVEFLNLVNFFHPPLYKLIKNMYRN
jgi:hypothetical protein